MFIPGSTHGYAKNFTYAVQAKWANNLNFAICLSNIQGKEYEHLFIKAVDEWKERWNHFGYTLSYASGCHINVYILKTYSMLEEYGYLGYTKMQYWNGGAIIKADLYLPTSKKVTVSTVAKGKSERSEVLEPLSKVQFYRAALHEFGHALNLGHFNDDGQEPIDIMYAHPASDDQVQDISQTDIEALNWLYLGFLKSEVSVRTDKSSYNAGDTMKISGRVSPVMPNEPVRVEVLDSDKKPYASETVKVDTTGLFACKLKIRPEVEGSFKIKAFYDDASADGSFDVNNPKRVS